MQSMMTKPGASEASGAFLGEKDTLAPPQPRADEPQGNGSIETNDTAENTRIDESLSKATSTDTNQTTTTTAPSRKRSKFSNASPKDILGLVDSFPHLQDARMALNQRVPWFKDHPIPVDLPIKYIESPPELDWEHAGLKEMIHMFPFWKLNNGRYLGKKQIPKCLMMDSQTEHERLVVLNWWRSRTGDQQVEIRSHQGLQRYYRAPMRSASPFQYAQQRYGKGLHALDLVKEHEHWEDRKARVVLAKELEQAAIDKASTAAMVALNNGGEELLAGTDKRTTTTKNSMLGMKTVFVRPTIANAPLGFRTIQSTFDLVHRFNLSVDILYCARTIRQACAIKDCVYPALDQNRGCCALHKQNWWVRKIGAQLQRRRGHLLLGPEYATRRTIDDVVTCEGGHRVTPVPCGCSNELCEAIGWSADTARVPKHYELPKGLVPGEHRDKDRPLRLAPWHFPPDSRLQLPDGTWKLVFGTKPEDFVSPDYDVSEFLNEPGMIEYQERKSLWLLPEWVHEMHAVEEGPPTLAEYQRELFLKQKKQMMFNANMAALSLQHLIQSHSEATTKIQAMKKGHTHKKRVPAMLSPRKKRLAETTSVVETETEEPDDEYSRDNEEDEDPSRADDNHQAPSHSARNPHFLFAPGGPSFLHPHHAQLHAALGGMHPYGAEAARLEEAATRVWGHYYANYGRQI